MKLNYKNLFLGLLFCVPFFGLSQVGINTTTPQAQLDITASNSATPLNTDGLLVPRIDNFPATNPTVTQNGMLVYLNTTVGVNNPGFYYWENATTSWKPISATTTSNSWSVTGNSGTVSGTNFIGTTDNKALDIRTNNTIKVRINGKGQIEVLNTGNSVFIGERAGQNDDLTNNNNVFVGKDAGLNNTTADANTFIGSIAGSSTTTGNLNTVVGAGAFDRNTTGSSNVIFGRSALSANTNGNNNIAIGESALKDKVLGSSNVVIGSRAMTFATNSSNNVAVGFLSGFNNLTGNNNVFLGYQAGYNELGSNKLYIANTNTANPLIYGDFASNLLRVNGTLNVNNAYNLPTTTGTANQVLQTDGAGNTSWANPAVVAETDPQVSSTTTNYIPKWNGTTLVDGQLFDNGTNVGIGTITPTDKVHIVGNIKIDGGRIPFINTGNSVFIGQNAGLVDDLTNNQNVFIGSETGKANTTGNLNTFIGYAAGSANTTGTANTSIGANALDTNTTGINNVTIGMEILTRLTTASNNLAVGTGAGQFITTGQSNTFVGPFTGSNATGSNNVY